ncbi:MAG: sigma-54-dependent transcriptional regulator [bacterium]
MEESLPYSQSKKTINRSKAESPLILVVDDQNKVRGVIKELLEFKGFNVDDAIDGTEAIEKIKNSVFDVVITDLKMEDYSGIDILKIAKEQYYDPEVLLITAYGSVDSAVKAIKLGAFDYLEKPLDLQKLMLMTEEALIKRDLKNNMPDASQKIKIHSSHKHIIAKSQVMSEILETVNLISNINSTVLIEGESGTGKELIARAIHFRGERKNKPFIAINCGALPEQLLESELFGYTKGAFTGAVSEKKGLFEEADCGTLLLDEIGDMPFSLQIKLLRVLQESEVRKIGSSSFCHVDVRIVASTNQKLSSLVKEGKFRGDLYYRLNVIPITVPPLRERKEDILPLLDFFVKKYSQKFKKNVKGFSQNALNLLMQYEWPGNIRELENFVERVVSFAKEPLIGQYELPCSVDAYDSSLEKDLSASSYANLVRAIEKYEKEFIYKSLHKNNWNLIYAAKDLGISRTSLWRKIKKYDIRN